MYKLTTKNSPGKYLVFWLCYLLYAWSVISWNTKWYKFRIFIECWLLTDLHLSIIDKGLLYYAYSLNFLKLLERSGTHTLRVPVPIVPLLVLVPFPFTFHCSSLGVSLFLVMNATALIKAAKQADVQADGQTDWHADKQTDRHADRLAAGR